MKGEKGITPVTVSESLEELPDETFSKCKLIRIYSFYISLEIQISKQDCQMF